MLYYCLLVAIYAIKIHDDDDDDEGCRMLSERYRPGRGCAVARSRYPLARARRCWLPPVPLGHSHWTSTPTVAPRT